MAIARQMSTITRCVRCQRHTLNGFLGLAGVSVHAQPSFGPRVGARTPFQRRYITNTTRVLNKSIAKSSESTHPNEERSRDISNEEHPAKSDQLDNGRLNSREQDSASQELADLEAEIQAELEAQEHENPDGSNSETPWYLQEDDPVMPIRSLAERQRLPAIPDDAPKCFPDILQRLSTDIGLDYIRLLDLRSLDPPPALGAGVMMLIGTARSEKHLHVSADRFARWLRATYKLRPNADGLLGRNELKLRLKRKAKRAKLLGSVGAVEKENEDDGLRIGWICVDAGVIEESAAVEKSLDGSGIVGFGGKTDGVKLVVQMMTDEKRREIDLESLWEKTLERHRRRLEDIEAARSLGDTEMDLSQEQLASQSLSARSS